MFETFTCMQIVDLKKYPKLSLLSQPSEIQYLRNLSEMLDVNLYIKRDDLNGIGLGGNKVRKLEYLLGEATRVKATHILTLGAIQSNHARLTAVTARMKGFEVELFLKESVPIAKESYLKNGNIVLEKIVDAKIHRIPNDNKMMQTIEERMEEIRQAGGNPYFIPVGGSNALGNLGYLDCYMEILNQQQALHVNFDYVAVASGSGGSHGGLIIGQQLTKANMAVKAYNVQPEHDELVDHTLAICNETLSWLGHDAIGRGIIDLNSCYSGSAYGFPENYHLETLKLLAKQEGIFLDPVYTAKAFSGLLEDIKSGIFQKGSHIVFIHTGGTPGIFAYQDWF